MARTKKDRSNEVSAVFNGLQYCTCDQLREVIDNANKLIAKKEKAEKAEKIKKLEEEIQKYKASLAVAENELEALK